MGRLNKKRRPTDENLTVVKNLLTEKVSEMRLDEKSPQKRLLSDSQDNMKKKKCKEKLDLSTKDADLSDNEDMVTDIEFELSSNIITDIWELIEIKKYLDDPYLSNQRKLYYTSRVPELTEDILKQLNKQINENVDETLILQQLHKCYNDDKYSKEQQNEFKFIFNRYLDKIIETNPDSVRLKKILDSNFLSEDIKNGILDKISKIQCKIFASSSAMDEHQKYFINDTIRLAEVIRRLMSNSFFEKNKIDPLLNKLRNYREKQTNDLGIIVNSNYSDDELHNATIFIRNPSLDQTVRMKVNEQMDNIRKAALNSIKNNKTVLQDKLMQNCEDILLFKGTNLEFVEGYGVTEPSYIRCVKVWKHKKN